MPKRHFSCSCCNNFFLYDAILLNKNSCRYLDKMYNIYCFYIFFLQIVTFLFLTKKLEMNHVFPYFEKIPRTIVVIHRMISLSLPNVINKNKIKLLKIVSLEYCVLNKGFIF